MSAYESLVVARFADGRLLHGSTPDFRRGRTLFHVIPEDSTEPVRISVENLKALFFVKTLFGDHTRSDSKVFRFRTAPGRRVWVRFRDGEEMAGWVDKYDPDDGGFELLPVDGNSNIDKAFIASPSVEAVYLDEDAEKAARQYEKAQEHSAIRKLHPQEWNHLLGLDGPKPKKATPPGPRRPPGKSRDSGVFLGDW